MNEKNIKINFILPFKPRRPAGGFRIMYEYANRLAEKGYKVHLTYPIATPYMKYRFPYPVRLLMSKIEKFNTNKWFTFNPAISMSYVPSVKDKYIENADIIICTWWATATETFKLNKNKGIKVNLIQGFENWEGHEDLLFESYDLPNVTNVVVASYLKDIVSKYTMKPVTLIHNSISATTFGLTVPIETRKQHSIVMTYSIQEIKGSEYGLAAIKKVKKIYPDLEVDLFGVCPEPVGLPSWISYHRNPANLNELYNKNAIILSNSLTEGFPLTPAEGMFCGCALICTNIAGHKEYAIDQQTALLVEPKNVDELTEKICYLFEHNEDRKNLATRGQQFIQQFEWVNSIEKMEKLLQSLLKKNQENKGKL